MKKFTILTLIIIFIFSCKKNEQEEVDQRTKYVGDYIFTTYVSIQETVSHTYDTIIYEGKIELFKYDEKSNIGEVIDEDQDSIGRLSISYRPEKSINPAINSKGEFLTELIQYYILTGKFINEDEVEFSINWGEGPLGYVDNYKIKGIRK